MPLFEQIRPGLDVIVSGGRHVGKVDALVSQLLRFEGDDTGDGGEHFLELAWLADMVGNQVKLLVLAAEAMEPWSVESG